VVAGWDGEVLYYVLNWELGDGVVDVCSESGVADGLFVNFGKETAAEGGTFDHVMKWEPPMGFHRFG